MRKQLKYEWFKLISNRLFMGSLVVLIIVNMAIFLIDLFQKKTYVVDYQYIESIEEEYKGFSYEEMYTQIKEKQEELTALFVIKSYVKNNLLDVLEAVYGDNPELIAKANQLSIEEIRKDNNAYKHLLDSLRYLNQYDKFLEDIEEQYVTVNQFSIFRDENSFNYRNITKTREDYEDLKRLGNQYNYRKGVTAFSNSKATEILTIFLVMLAASTIFWQERDRKLWSLLNANKLGRKQVVFAKIFMYILVCIGIGIVMYGSILFLSSKYVGLGDLSAKIQSISEFSKCSLSITVMEYLGLYFIFKLFAIIVIASLLACIYSSINNYNLATGLFFSFVVLSIICYREITIFSSWNKWKFLNVYGIIDTKYIVGDYINLNFFGYPVNLLTAQLLYGGALFLLCLTITIYKMSNARFLQNKATALPCWLKGKRNSSIITISHLFPYELYKAFILKKLLFVIIGVLFISYLVRLEIQPVFSLDSFVYITYMEDLEGEWTEEKEAFIIEEKEKYDNLFFEQQMYQEQYINGEIDSKKYEYHNERIKAMLLRRPGFDLVYFQYEYLMELENPNKGFVNQVYGDYFFNNYKKDTLEFTIYFMALILLFSIIYVMEYKNHAWSLIRSTKLGRGRLFWNKVSVCLLSIFLCFPIYIRRLVDMNQFYPLRSWNHSLNSLEKYSNMPNGITLTGYVIIRYLIIIYISVILMGIAILVSLKTKKIIDTLLTMSLFVVIPIFMEFLGVKWIKYGSLMNGVYGNELFASNQGIVVFCINLFVVTVIFVLCFSYGYRLFVGKRVNMKKMGVKACN